MIGYIDIFFIRIVQCTAKMSITYAIFWAILRAGVSLPPLSFPVFK